MFRFLFGAALPLLAACSLGSSAAAPPPTAPAPAATAAPPARAPVPLPAQAVLSDALVGSPRTGGQDHLSAAEAARDQPDQPAALDLYASWGWLDAATRTWPQAGETVLLAASAQGARRAAAYWLGGATSPAPATSACPPGVRGLDACAQRPDGGRVLVVGRLGALAFRLDCPAADAERLAAAQAALLAPRPGLRPPGAPA